MRDCSDHPGCIKQPTMTTSGWTTLLRWVSLVALLLSACSTSSPTQRAWVSTEQDDASVCESSGTDSCIVLACDGEQGECGVFACEDVDLEASARASLAHGAELARGSYRLPTHGPSRNWRHLGLRAGARPRTTFHFHYRHGALPAFPRDEGKLVKHHLFPQAPEFREWFRQARIDIHQYALLIPEPIHRQLHSGTGRGGLWNTAWREFRRENPNLRDPEAFLRHAFKLAIRYKLAGPILPYNHRVLPIGPQFHSN
ncbi:TIGR02269 family lipoprotein [Hyalangium rubrum]|uniref:TIGR02269 family lipoprotein n=1 Tax=Hyalangium rubrum TaxID=3103134 RepID=A0ABU5H3S5_9BACT|nr:TIGR02269 family lipoprotein [Hyalangium sp. s54d21]MDY7227458.1 TIGR02269 family lipoprotein [Hyalangium sp. s54d21]